MVRALTNQNRHLFQIVRLMPISSMWALLALVTDMKIEILGCKQGHFSFPIAFMATQLYVFIVFKDSYATYSFTAT